VENTGVTPEELLRDFGSLVDSQTKSLRALATTSNVGVETIRGWKDMGRFPRSTDDFMTVVRTCLQHPKPAAVRPPWRIAEWEVRYQEAKRVWENREGTQKPISAAPGGPAPFPSIQVTGGDYVQESKNTIHIGDVNHHPRGC
jgi:hypothetical protein